MLYLSKQSWQHKVKRYYPTPPYAKLNKLLCNNRCRHYQQRLYAHSEKIKILYKDGTVTDSARASDQYNIESLAG